jgi:hypothetical protein
MTMFALYMHTPLLAELLPKAVASLAPELPPPVCRTRVSRWLNADFKSLFICGYENSELG